MKTYEDLLKLMAWSDVRRAREALTTLRDAARDGKTIDFKERDPLIDTLSRMIDIVQITYAVTDDLRRERDRARAKVIELNNCLLYASARAKAKRTCPECKTSWEVDVAACPHCGLAADKSAERTEGKSHE